jgi:hypothetical protein
LQAVAQANLRAAEFAARPQDADASVVLLVAGYWLAAAERHLHT